MNEILLSPSDRSRLQDSATVSGWYTAIKRALDILISLAALACGLPLWALIALAIRVSSPGRVLYIADTVGKDGKVFRLFKFRTMRVDGGESLHKEYLVRFVRENEPHTIVRGGDGEERRIYKIVNDRRVTAAGRLLRGTGLDEVPQFINVLKGEMSIVGPRPPRLAEYENYQEWHKERLNAMPGITGLYQITARSIVPFDEMVLIDLRYIRDRSLWLDFKIMLLTFPVMVLRKGGY